MIISAQKLPGKVTIAVYSDWRKGGTNFAMVHQGCGGYFKPKGAHDCECTDCGMVFVHQELDTYPIYFERYFALEIIDVIKLDTATTVDFQGKKQVYRFSRPLTPDELAEYKKKNGIF